MFLTYLIERLPRSEQKNETNQLRTGENSLYRENLEKEIKTLLNEIRIRLSEKKTGTALRNPSKTLSIRDFAREIFTKEQNTKILIGEEALEEKNNKNKTSSLYNFLDAKKNRSEPSAQFLVDLIQAIFNFSRRDNSKIAFLDQKYKSFYLKGQTCVDIHNYVLKIGIKTDADFEDRIKKDFVLQQLFILFLKNFEEGFKFNQNLKLIFKDEANNQIYPSAISFFMKKFENTQLIKNNLSEKIDEMAGKVSKKIYLQKNISNDDQKILASFLKSIFKSSDSSNDILAKRNELIRNLFLSLYDLLEDYEKKCQNLRFEIQPSIKMSSSKKLLTDDEYKLLEEINLKQKEMFEKNIPNWDSLLPLPPKIILKDLISNQISFINSEIPLKPKDELPD